MPYKSLNISKFTFVLSFLIFALYTSSFAHREAFYYLQGTFGEKEVAVQIDNYDVYWYAKYYFMADKKDIVMRGGCDSIECSFQVTSYDKETKTPTVREELTIKENTETHNWEGTWLDRDSVLHDVFLKPIIKDSIDHNFNNSPFVERLTPYSYLRTADITFKKVGKKKIGKDFKATTYKHEHTGILMFRISKGLNPAVSDSINTSLETSHLSEIEGYYSCSSLDFDGSYFYKPEISFINSKLLCMKIHRSYNCQGMKDNDFNGFVTLSTETGKEIRLEEFLWFGGDMEKPRYNSGPWYQYRYKVFGEQLLYILKELYPEQINAEGNCKYNSDKAWEFPDWHLTPEGIYMGAHFPGIDRACDGAPWSIIPYQRLEPFLNPDFKLTD